MYLIYPNIANKSPHVKTKREKEKKIASGVYLVDGRKVRFISIVETVSFR